MILTLILLVLTLLVLAGAIFLTFTTDPDLEGAPKKPAWLAFAVLLVLTVLTTGFRIIPAGHVGVVTWLGEVENRTLQPGPQFVVPIFQSIIEVETRVRAIPFENLAAASEEYQDVLVTGVLNIHIDNTGVNDLYQRVGLDYQDKIVVPFFSQILKEIMPEYPIDQILLKREEIRQRVVESLNAKVNEYSIIIDDVALAQIAFSDAYTNAIEDKQVQEQRVLTERQILEQRRIQAEQRVVQAEGEAQARIAEAEGEAEANRVLTESLSDELIRYTGITRLSDKINIALVPSDGGLILDVGGLVQPEPSPAP